MLVGGSCMRWVASARFVNRSPVLVSRILSAQPFTTAAHEQTRYTHFLDEYKPIVPPSISPVVSQQTMNSKQALGIKKKEMIDKFQKHHADTGSSQVQSMC